MARSALIIVLSLLCVTPDSHAHRAHFSLTDMWWRVDLGTLEITHSIHLDDAMVLLASLGSPEGTLDAVMQAKLMHYVEQRFAISDGGRALNPQAVGAQIEGDFLWLYQELPLTSLPEQLRVSCRLMQDFSPDQVNQVNFRVGDDVRTLRMTREHEEGQIF